MDSTQQHIPTILVTDAHRNSAVVIIRSLGRRGWRVVAADSDRLSPGLRSRYVAGTVRYPDPKEQPRALVDALVKATETFGVDLIIPVTDEVILPLAEERGRFKDRCRLAIPDDHALEIVTDKRKTYALAVSCNVPVPKTYLVSTIEEAVALASELEWPVVLKPQSSRLYERADKVEILEVSYANDVDDLAEQMASFEGHCTVLLQEYCRGTGHGVELLMHRGRPLAAFQHRRLREVPITGGASAFRESVPLEPTLYDHSVRMLEALNWTGLAMVEFKVGDDGVKLMEINGRVWGSLPLAVHSGMDFPARLAELYLRGPSHNGTAPDTNYATGVRARSLERDLVWIAEVLLGHNEYPFLPTPSRREAVRALVQLLNPAYKFDILTLDDPRPAVVELIQIVNKFRRKLVKHDWKHNAVRV